MTPKEERQMGVDLAIKELGVKYDNDLKSIDRCIAKLEEIKADRTKEYEREFTALCNGGNND